MRPERLHQGVVVVGAGIAGLAATRRLRARGVPVTLIEAGRRAGGRAWTSPVLGEPFDHGATWLHDADRNPLAALAHPGELDASHDGRDTRLTLNGQPATPADHAAYAAAEAQLDRLAEQAAAQPNDPTLAQAMAPMQTDPWARLIVQWEGAIIAAADADVLGFRDWRRNRLDGRNLVPRNGLGAYVLHHVGTAAVLNTPALAIEWAGPGVRVLTPGGAIQAAACIVTVGTGPLAAGRPRFHPPLPAPVQQAIHALPMGLLSKVVLPAPPGERLGLSPGTVIEDQAGLMSFNAWPQGRAHMVGFAGGRTAWQVAADPATAEALARAELARALGANAVRRLGKAACITAWGTDPLFLGSYAYAGPGDAGQRAVLAAAFPGERLLFAGEALRTDGLAGTAGGAFLSGVEAADQLLA